MWAARACEEKGGLLGLLDFLKPCLGFGWLYVFLSNCPERGWKGFCPYLEGVCLYPDCGCCHFFLGHSHAM
jgi:hypothetical protein